MSEPKRLLVIAGGTYIFGAEKVTLDVIKGLSREGYEINALISGWNDGAFAKALDKMQVSYYPLKLGWYYTSKILWSLDSLVHYPGALIRFLRIRKKFKDWPVYIISFRQVILLWPFFKKDIVYHVHDANAMSKQSRFFLKLINRKVNKFIAVSEFIKTDLVACGIAAEKIEVVYNGLDILPALPKDQRNASGLTIGIVGQVIERKGHIAVLQALDLLVKRGYDVALVIAGEGDAGFVTKLKSMITHLGLEQKVHWRGFKTNLQEIYEGIEVLVAPTIHPEPFGLIAIEANMLEIPVIATDGGGFKETITEGENGWLIPLNDAGQLAERIGYFYNNRQSIETMGKKGRERVIQQFDKKIMITKIDKILSGL